MSKTKGQYELYNLNYTGTHKKLLCIKGTKHAKCPPKDMWDLPCLLQRLT